MDRHASCFAKRHQTRHDAIGIAVLLGQNFAVIIGRNAAHIVMDSRNHGDRFLRHIDAGKDARAFRNAGESLVQHLRIEMVEMQEYVILVLADATTFANFDRHGARNDIARGKVLGGRCITLHEAFAIRIGDIAAFAARTFGDQAT